ncbi:hypothetical protein ACFYNO_01265 [Kitasatospora sp. NPDC006697]|uniref:hypothetical protein n=1 Tax=Kitasatospora sp. NPDC006697 TaxID=3364020 RepID=UPI0036CF9A78
MSAGWGWYLDALARYLLLLFAGCAALALWQLRAIGFNRLHVLTTGLLGIAVYLALATSSAALLGLLAPLRRVRAQRALAAAVLLLPAAAMAAVLRQEPVLLVVGAFQAGFALVLLPRAGEEDENG